MRTMFGFIIKLEYVGILFGFIIYIDKMDYKLLLFYFIWVLTNYYKIESEKNGILSYGRLL